MTGLILVGQTSSLMCGACTTFIRSHFPFFGFLGFVDLRGLGGLGELGVWGLGLDNYFYPF